MASKIKVDNITDQDDNAVISRCGSTHTVTAEVYKADTIKDTSNNTYLAKCGTAITLGGGSDTTTVPGAAVVTGNVTGANLIASGNVVKSNAYQASDGEMSQEYHEKLKQLTTLSLKRGRLTITNPNVNPEHLSWISAGNGRPYHASMMMLNMGDILTGNSRFGYLMFKHQNIEAQESKDIVSNGS